MDKMEWHNKQTASLRGLLENCQEMMNNGTVTDLIAYKTKLGLKNHEFRVNPVHDGQIENFLKFDAEEEENGFLAMIQDVGSLTIDGSLPAQVKVFDMPLIAGLYSNVSFELRNAHGDLLPDYPVTVSVLDSFDDTLPAVTQHRDAGRYEFTVRPMVSGLHRLTVQFLNQTIAGSGRNLNVLSNNPVALIGEKGFAAGEMDYPRAVAVNSDSTIYCVDTGNNRIQVFSKSGDFMFSFPISGDSDNFSSCGVAINLQQGTVICPEVRMHEADMARADTILIYTLEGRLLHKLSFRDTLSKALCVAVNSLGHMIVADYELHRIFIIDKHGRRLLRQFGDVGSAEGQFDHPTFVCVGDDDSIIVSDGDNHRIQVFDKAGKFLYKFGRKGTGKGEFMMPFGVATDHHGNILVVDGGNKRIQVFKVGGEFSFCIESLGDKMNAPRGIAVTSDGHVLVADRDNHCIKKFKYLHSTLL